MPEGHAANLVRQMFKAWETSDRATVERLLASDFTFTSPRDDHLTRDQYFEICWPHAGEIKHYDVLNLNDFGDEGFIRYECETADGKRFRNTEYFRVVGDQIREIDVYFGRDL